MLDMEKIEKLAAAAGEVIFYKHWCEDRAEAVAFVEILGEPEFFESEGVHWARADLDNISAVGFYKMGDADK